MHIERDRVETILRAIIHECKVEQITFMAGSIAYNAFVSLLPLLFLMLAIVSAIGGGQLEANLIALTQSIVTPGVGEILASELNNVSLGASILGFAVLTWGMLRIFRILDMAVSDIYETESANSFSDQLKDSIIVFSSIGGVILAVAFLEALFGISEASGALWVVQRFLLVIIVGVALFPMYYLFPDEPGITVKEVLPGLVFTTVSLIVFQSIFSIYVEYSSELALNNILASIIVFLTWLYFNGLVILVGAAINAVISNRSEDVNIEPVFSGEPKTVHREIAGDTRKVPDEALDDLKQSLNDVTEFRIVLESVDKDFRFPTPDMVTVDTDFSPPTALNDTANIELKWAQDQAIKPGASDD